MTLAETPINQTALEGAKVAIAIAASQQTSEDIVLRSREFADLDGAVHAAIKAHEYPGVSYRTVDVPASYNCHGAHADVEPEMFPLDAYVTALVRIKSEHPVDELTQISVISSIQRDIHRAASRADAYISRLIFVIDEPA
ncbi:hypothetical protein OVA26_16775 [Microbacterium sp. SL62]|uniref:hypothetical protein n=1 Tax=Microbacterium sp. SL62 TaxID=2995139 RepID=UPI002274EAA9|nr:hypothetical protein [Microbacterium sp. SL62]MCY1718593.1 hypothetical protein [Microbacterium sp. SL62]